MEKLYDDDNASKLHGTSMIGALTRDPRNLEALASNETLMALLSRLFKEEYRKSVELSANIAAIFFTFSTFSQMHRCLSLHRVGDTSLRVL